jgi:hypothetical protein
MKLTRITAVGTLMFGIAFGGVAAGASEPPAVEGHGSGIYVHPPFTGDRVSVEVEASGSGGRFDVIHYDKLGNVFAHLSGTLDCVAVDGRQAFTTGTITAGFAPEVVGNVDGKAFAITILDNGDADVVGVSYPLDQIPACSPWPLNTAIDRGSYTIGG